MVTEGDEDTDIEGLNQNLARNFTAARRKVPRIESPFNAVTIGHLMNAINAATEENYTPEGFGFFEHEQNYESWKTRVYITVNRTDVGVTLPEAVWVPRVERWLRGVEFLTQLQVSH